MGESHKLKTNARSNIPQVNLFNRYSKKDRTDSIGNNFQGQSNQGLPYNNHSVHNISKIKTEISEEPNLASQ